MINVDIPKHLSNVEGPTFTGDVDEDFSSLFGIAIGKKAKARVAAKREARQEKKATKRQLKKEKKQAKIDLKKARAEAKRTRANKGTGGIGGFLSGILGGGQEEEVDDSYSMDQAYPPAAMPTAFPGPATFTPYPNQESFQDQGGNSDDGSGDSDDDDDSDDKKKWYQNPLVIAGGVAGLAVLGFIIYLVAKR